MGRLIVQLGSLFGVAETMHGQSFNLINWDIISSLKAHGDLGAREARMANVSLLWKLIWVLLYDTCNTLIILYYT